MAIGIKTTKTSRNQLPTKSIKHSLESIAPSHLDYGSRCLFGSFPFVNPITLCPSITEHVPLRSKSSCKNKARSSDGVANIDIDKKSLLLFF